MPTILFYGHEDAGQASRLEAALATARVISGHLNVCQPISVPIALDSVYHPGLVGGGIASIEILRTLENYADEQRTRLEAKLAAEDVPWSWRRIHNDHAAALVQESVLADLIVLSAPGDGEDAGHALRLIAEVVMRASAPVLTIPVGHPRFDPAGPVLVAWDGSVEAAQTLRLSRDLLRRASQIRVVTVDRVDRWKFDSEEVAAYMNRLGLSVEVADVPDEGGTTESLLREAQFIEAAYILMGAYGHSRLREFMLGGVTSKMLAQQRFPLLMHH